MAEDTQPGRRGSETQGQACLGARHSRLSVVTASGGQGRHPHTSPGRTEALGPAFWRGEAGTHQAWPSAGEARSPGPAAAPPGAGPWTWGTHRAETGLTGAPPQPAGRDPHLYISSDSSLSSCCFSWMSRNQSTMRSSSVASVESGRWRQGGCTRGLRTHPGQRCRPGSRPEATGVPRGSC